MKLYEKTFCGSDAVDWFLLYLRSNQKFGQHVSRAQSKQLLQKFLENGIFEDARGKDSKGFEDDNHLYRFTEKADEICQNKKEIVSQRSVTNLLRSVSIRRDKKVPVPSTDSESGSKVVRNRNLRRVARSQSMRQALLSPRSSTIPAESIGVTPLSKNLTQFKIDSSGKKVSDEEAGNITEESVASSAIIAEETNKVSSYDGKENDPLAAEQLELDISIEEHYSSILQQAGINNRAFVVEEMSPLVSTFTRSRSLRDPRAMKYRHTFMVNCDDEEGFNEPGLNLHKSLRRSLKRQKSNSQVTGIKFTKTDECVFSPPKRKKIDDGSSRSLRNETTATKRELKHKPGGSNEKVLKKSRDSDSSIFGRNRRVKSVETLYKDSTIFGLKEALEVDNLDDYVNLTVVTNSEIESNVKNELKTAEVPEWVMSAMKFLVNWPDKDNSDGSVPSYEGFQRDVFLAIQDYYQSTLKEPIMTYNLFKLLDLASESIAKDHLKAILIFQYLCLIVPPWNRKQIYLILRFMDKVSRNAELKLDERVSNKDLVVNSLHSIMIRNKEMQFPSKDNTTSIKAVRFMIENHEHILQVPLELKSRLTESTKEMSFDPISSWAKLESNTSFICSAPTRVSEPHFVAVTFSYEMGLTASAYEQKSSVEVFTRSAADLSNNRDKDVYVSRKFERPGDESTKLRRYACPSDANGDWLPGLVDEWKSLAVDEDVLSHGSFEGYPMGFLKLRDYFHSLETNQRRIKTARMDEVKSAGRKKTLIANTQSFDSIRAIKPGFNTSRYPLLQACGRPKRVKSSMLEAFLSIVPSLKRVDSKTSSKDQQELSEKATSRPRVASTPSCASKSGRCDDHNTGIGVAAKINDANESCCDAESPVESLSEKQLTAAYDGASESAIWMHKKDSSAL
eukprot:gene7943-8798_t